VYYIFRICPASGITVLGGGLRFLIAFSYARQQVLLKRVLDIAILSVCPSVRPSHE